MQKMLILLCSVMLLSLLLTACVGETSSSVSVSDVSLSKEIQTTQKTKEPDETITQKENSLSHTLQQQGSQQKTKEDVKENQMTTAANADLQEKELQKDKAVKQYDEALTGKYVCLTFDDGPAGNNTPKVLKTLKKYDVKGTFFVCGPDSPDRRKMMKQAIDDGHAIGIHCYSHKLKSLYKSEESFFADFDKMENIIKEVTGSQPTLYRFPGGANNGFVSKKLSETLIIKLKDRGYEYYDWNASGRDDSRPAAEVITSNAVAQCKARAKSKTPTILLLHDSAGRYTSADALPGIIQQLKAKGFEFIPITEAVKPVHLAKK